MSPSQSPLENFPSARSSSCESSRSAPPDDSNPSRGDPGSQVDSRAIPAAPPAAQSRGFQPARGYGALHDSARGYGTVHDSSRGYGAGYGMYGTSCGTPVRARRSGAEIGHLVGLCFALTFFVLMTLFSYVRIRGYVSDGSAAIILMQNVLFNPFVWFMAGATIQAVRRRPTILTVAAFVITGLNAATQLTLWRNIMDVAINFTFILLLVLGIVGSASAWANRDLDGRPVPVTLAAGMCAGLAAREVFAFARALYYVMIRENDPETLMPGPWSSVASILRFSLPPALPLALSLISFAGALLGISGILAPRGGGARGRLVMGSLIAACTYIVFCALPAEVDPKYSGSLFAPRLVSALVLGTLLLLSLSLPVLMSGRQWFEAQKQAKTDPAATGIR